MSLDLNQLVRTVVGVYPIETVVRTGIEYLSQVVPTQPPTKPVIFTYAMTMGRMDVEVRKALRIRHNLTESQLRSPCQKLNRGEVGYDGNICFPLSKPDIRNTKQKQLMAEVKPYLDQLLEEKTPVTVDTLTRMAITLDKHRATITGHIQLFKLASKSVLEPSDDDANLPICKNTVKSWLMVNDYQIRRGQITLKPARSELIGPSERFQNLLLYIIFTNPGARFINMDQTSVITDLSNTKSVICKKGQEPPRTLGDAKRAATFILSVSLTGDQLPPCIIETGVPCVPVEYDVKNVCKTILDYLAPSDGQSSPNQVKSGLELLGVKRGHDEMKTRRTTVRIDQETTQSPQDEKNDGVEEYDENEVMLEQLDIIIRKYLCRDLANNACMSQDFTTLPQVEDLVQSVLKVVVPCVNTEFSDDEILKLKSREERISKTIEALAKATEILDATRSVARARDIRDMQRGVSSKIRKKDENEKLHKEKLAEAKNDLNATRERMKAKKYAPGKVSAILKRTSVKRVLAQLREEVLSEVELKNITSDELEQAREYFDKEMKKCIEDAKTSEKKFVPSETLILMKQNKGWTDHQIMLDYIQHVLMAGHDPNIKTFLILDNFSAHRHPDVLKLMKDNNIEPIFVPRNCTGWLQPLDVSVNKHFKAKKRLITEALQNLEYCAEAENEAYQKMQFASKDIASCAFIQPYMRREVILNGWRRALRHALEP